MKDVFLKQKIIRSPGELKKHYDVVIVGGGSHGLATAYYLSRAGMPVEICRPDKTVSASSVISVK